MKHKIERQRLVQVEIALGAVVIVALVGGAVVGGLFWLASQFSDLTLRWLVVVSWLALPVSIPVTWRIATNAAREHLRGFDRGLDGAERTIQSVGRGLSATASLARTAARQPALPMGSNDDLLPRPGTMRIVDAGRGSGEILDL
ncbi:MAG: hypothetical protein JW850_15745 [Thermoflexales bacterium]|nr:hypothetical protein [Thermoflexales bacterium]